MDWRSLFVSSALAKAESSLKSTFEVVEVSFHNFCFRPLSGPRRSRSALQYAIQTKAAASLYASLLAGFYRQLFMPFLPPSEWEHGSE